MAEEKTTERSEFDIELEEEAAPEAPVEEAAAPEENYKEKYEQEHNNFLRLAAEYDNFRKRSQKEKDSAYGSGKADTLAKLLPVYDNLERAMNQETTDAAYKKGVELTMQGLLKIFGDLGVEVYGESGDEFDPNLHNAVMHIESEDLGENTISQVFQKGFKTGEKVIRFAMVQVAN